MKKVYKLNKEWLDLLLENKDNENADFMLSDNDVRILLTYIEVLQQENARLKEFKKEHEIMKKILIEKGLWETLLNDDRFLEYLREEN